MRFAVVFLAFAACSTPPRVDPILGDRADSVIAEMERGARADVIRPPLLYHMSGNWAELCFGEVIAVGMETFAAQFKDERGIPDSAANYLVPVCRRDDNTGIIGDGVVMARLGDILVCRYFPRPYGSTLRPQLGDEVWIDWETTEAMRRGW